LRDWRITSTAVLFAKAARRVQKPTPVQFLWHQTERVDTARYLGATLDTRLTRSAHANQVRQKGSSKTGRAWPPL
jgi:hypothetical protein